jgi:TldD protein
MLNQAQLESLLSRAMNSSADFAEIFEEDGTSESISMLNGEVEDVNRMEKAGVGIRLYKDVQSVYGYTNDFEMSALEKMVDDLRDALGREEKGAQVKLTRQEIENIHPIKIDPIDAPLADKVAIMLRADKSARAQEKIVKASASLSSVRQNVQISNSNGRLVSDQRVRTRLFQTAFSAEEGKMESRTCSPGGSMGLEFYEIHTPEEIGKEAARSALVMLSAKECPSGKMPVIIDNGFGGVIFHEACGHALEASAVSKNQSVFAGKLGTQIANPKVTAIDDGTIPNAWGSQNVDDEGNPQQRRVLIENGILKSYMIDTLNGRRMNQASTGSSRRQSYKYEPTSRMSNTFIAPGTDTFEDMLAGIEKGLYAKKMGGGSVNPATGEFNFAVSEGYMIENGKITYPVRGAALIGNGAEIIMNIDMVGDNLDRAQGMCGASSGSIPTDVGQPRIRVSSITVGGTSNE